jgi:tetratricopeptide (TPR) repeat protein
MEQLGDLNGAAARFGELTEARARALGPDAPDTVWALQGLTRVLTKLDSHVDARLAYARLYETQDRRLGPHADETLDALRGLAWELRKVGELDASRRCWQQLVETHEQIHGGRDERTVDSLVWLAEATEEMGDLEQARSISERIAGPLGRLYASSRESLGEDDPVTLNLTHGLGLTLERLGQLDAARNTYQTALDAYLRIQGRRGRAVADLRGHLADVARKTGDPAAAHTMYGEALAVLRKDPGPEDPDTLEMMSRDAVALLDMGKKIAAKNQVRMVVDGFRRTLGEENELTRRARNRLEAMATGRRRGL